MVQSNSSIFNFKLFLYKVFLPYLISIISLSYCLTYFFERKIILGSPISGAYKINRVINEVHPLEIPIFGSSRAKNNYVPSILGKNYFNYGLDGTRDDVMLMMMREECNKKKDSSRFIISNFDLEGRFPLTGDISNYLYNSNYRPIKQLLGKNYKTYYKIPVIKYFGLYQTYLESYISNLIQRTNMVDNGGQFLKTPTPANEFKRLVAQRSATKVMFHNDPNIDEDFKKLIKAHPGRTFIFVIAPYHTSYFDHYANIEEADQYLNELRNIENVKVFDFSHLIYPDDCFMNSTHLNYKGAKIFSSMLRDSLNNIF